MLFLEQFSKWVQNWDKLGQTTSKRCGKLSRETSFALAHTSSALVKLSNYLIMNFGFEYVLLGKFQTDPLEARFGEYRQLSGGNYNVSVPQVLESEKKLKLLNLLSLNSKYGKFTIRDLKCNSESDADNTNLAALNLAPFDSVMDSVIEYEINEHDSDVLLFISGYVSNSISGKLKCRMCSNRLCTKEDLMLEKSSVSEYFTSLNRGGLKFPTLFSLSICTVVFKVFQCILNEFEDQFVRAKYQRNIMINICLLFLDGGDCDEICPNCERSIKQIYTFCIRTMSNILLNNYTKVFNNNIAETNNRKKRMKLSTLE